jgi:hypothetical protein
LSKRAGHPHAGPCGQSARCSARTRRSPKPAQDPHADKQTIAFNGARYGGLHKFHQISFGYCQTIFNSRIFLLIYSSVGYRNLSHQVIEDSSQHNHFNNSYGTVSIPQILCCINCISLSFEFYWNFRAHTCHLSFVSSIGGGAKSRALLKVSLTILIGHCRAEWSFSMQWCSRICWFEDNRIDPIDRRKWTKHERGDVTLWKFNVNTHSAVPIVCLQSTHLRRCGDPSIGRNINPCQGNV